MEARNRSLPEWLTRIRTRQIVLPRFQRHETWSHFQIRDLLNTVLKELPAGAILTLDIGEKEPFVSRPIVGAPNHGEKITEHLLDGQQRLTSFWRSLNDLYEDRIFLIKLEFDEELDLPYFATSVSRYKKNDRVYPLWIDSPIELWEKKFIPVYLLRPDNEAEFQTWATSASNDNLAQYKAITGIGHTLRQKFATFNIPFLSLPVTTTPESALDVFIKMNTSSSPLTPFDIVVAQIEAATDKSLHEYIDELKKEIPNITRYSAPEDTVLAVIALLQDKLPSKGTYLSAEFSRYFENNWDKAKLGIRKAVAFLSDEKIFDSRRLPSDVVIYVISALWANAHEGLDREGDIRIIIRKYVWRAFFTERYDRTTNSRAFSDYKELLKLIRDGNGSPEIFNDNIGFYPLATTDELSATNWPYRKDRLARAILTISLKSGGFDFADGAPASYENIQTREYHHIYPQAWLKEKGFKEYEINSAINCALISWKTNRNISAKTPSEYIAERMEKSSLGDAEVTRRLESHLIPSDSLITNDYTKFIKDRAELIKKLVDKLCAGEIVEGML